MPIALVTGGAIRVGRAIATALAEAGYDLIVHAHHSPKAAQEVVTLARRHGRRAEVVVADLTTAAGVDALVTATRSITPSLDALVNNAALYDSCAFAELTRERYHRTLALNIEAPLFLAQSLVPLLHGTLNPTIVNITDAALGKPYAGYAHYMISKAALAEMTRALAVELAPRVRVNAVAPGTVAFPESFASDKRQRIRQRIPLGREGDVGDIGSAVLYLVRDATYVTGHTLVVDGGAALS